MLTRGQKISLTLKKRFANGEIKPTNYWKGKKRTEETKQKIKNKLVGRVLSEDVKNKVSIGLKKAYKEGRHIVYLNTGRTHFKKGNTSWNKDLKGIHLSEKSEFKNGENCGESNSNWKGGITKVNRRIRVMIEFKEWRKSVFERDNYTCQKCKNKKSVSGKLHSHHIIELYKLIEKYNIKNLVDARKCEELWNIDNGITYCKNCHLIHHGLLKKTVNSGEAQTDYAVGNPEPSSEGKKVSEKVHRLGVESQQ